MRFSKRFMTLIVFFSFFLLPVAAQAASLSSLRFHSGSDHDRIVFDLSEAADYELDTSADGRTVTLVLKGVRTKSGLAEPSFHGSRVQSVIWTAKGSEVEVTVKLAAGCKVTAGALAKPARIFLDAMPASAVTSGKTGAAGNAAQAGRPAEKTSAEVAAAKRAAQEAGLPEGTLAYQLAPGLMEYAYNVWQDNGWLTAYFLDVDPEQYTWKPVLGQGQVPGLAKLSAISDDKNATAAINASFFNWNGDLIGVTMIDGSVVGTTYIERSAVGRMKDGTTRFGTITYSGMVTAGGVTQYVGGVDAERGTDSLVLYNKYYGKTTRTNEYGRELTVVDGRVTAIRQGNSPIPANGWVVSLHGAAAAKFAGVKIGDEVEIEQSLGSDWQGAEEIVSVGPRLVRNGAPYVTTTAEQLGDIDLHREPRSAFAVTKRGTYLLAVADGRQQSSHGQTLAEWARLLIAFGAQDALNLDGGGSSELLAGGRVLNNPSDGRERGIGLGIVILPR